MMRNKTIFVLFTLIAALVLAAGGCGTSDKSSPSVDPVTQDLVSGKTVTGTSQADCDNAVVLEAVNSLCEIFGGSCVSQQSSCNDYERQLYTGSLLAANGTAWNGRGGSGEQMADTALCTLRELSPQVQGGGPLTSSTSINLTGVGTVKVEQNVGYLDFDSKNARFKGYRTMHIELPVVGKIDALSQDIDLKKTSSGTSLSAGGYPISGGYGLNLKTEEKSKSLIATPPAVSVLPPIGSAVSVSPSFLFRSNSTVADGPYTSDHTYIMLSPDIDGEVALDLLDIYGIQKGLENTAQAAPGLDNFKEKRGGWISQIGLGSRGTLTGGESIWTPPSSGAFSRPDYDATGSNDFRAYQPRSDEENQPSLYVKASATVKYPQNEPFKLLPAWVKNVDSSPTAYIQVTPTIEAGAAGQFGIVFSEGTNYYQSQSGLANDRLASMALYSGVKASAQFYINTVLRIKISSGENTLIDINHVFPVLMSPLTGVTPTASGVHFATAYSISINTTPDFPETIDLAYDFSLTERDDPQAFITQCYANEIPAEQPPVPAAEKGDPDDLFKANVWPCNICIATNGSGTEPAHTDLMMQATTPPTWQCDTPAKTGCMDWCSWDKTYTAEKPNLVFVAGPATIAGGIPAGNPQRDFFIKTCLEDSTAPMVVSINNGKLTDFPINGNITAEFSEAMDSGTINGSTFHVSLVSGATITGSFTYENNPYVVTFDPYTDLASGATYSVIIQGGSGTGVKDLAGNYMPTTYTATFSTATTP